MLEVIVQELAGPGCNFAIINTSPFSAQIWLFLDLGITQQGHKELHVSLQQVWATNLRPQNIK